MPPKKLQSTDYHVAWIAPVSDLELLPSRLMLDEEHDAPDYDTAYDDNVYTCGALAGHNVVIATCAPGMTGNVNAGRVTGSMFKTFSSIRMAVLVGIGGGVPRAEPSDDPTEDVHLGDVVVGWPGDGGPACIYYDSGRWHTDGKFEVLGTINRPDQVLLNALGKLVSDHEMDRSTFDVHRKLLLQSKHNRKFTFPGLQRDQLFNASYQHAGIPKNKCASCDSSQLVQRPERTEEEATGFIFHRGRIATGNAVVKDGERRDQIRDQCNGALCIEMEAAGVDAGRPCLVIRGISDYADSHKGDVWRSYAAGNAAVFARELLSKIPPSSVRNLAIEVHFSVPFSRNEHFVGREEILGRLLQRLPPIAHPDACQRTVIHGLGGIGKTQVAIEAAYRVRDAYPECSVFWVPAVDMTMFDNAYREIGRALKIQGIDDDAADVKTLVKAALSRNDAKPWLLIIDNVDDLQLLTDGRLTSHLPFSGKGSILFTTRNRQVTAHLQAREGVFDLVQLSDDESRQLLHQGLQTSQIGDEKSTTKLLEYLVCLPLAIRQASAYMQLNMYMTIAKYLEICKASNQNMIAMLSRDFGEQDRYEKTANAIATTWLISFEQIARDAPLAASYLRNIAYFAEKDIPISLLPDGREDWDKVEAVSVLKGYAFILDRGTVDRFDIHRLVHIAMRNWIQTQGDQGEQVTEVMCQVSERFPWPTHENRDVWTSYLPHAQTVLEFRGHYMKKETLGLLQHNIAEVYNFLGQYEEAEQMHRKELELSEKVLGPENPSTFSSMNNLASVLNNQGKYEEAEQMHRKTLALSEKVLGPENPSTLDSMNNLALVLNRQGKYEEAEQMHRKTLALYEKVLGPENPSTLTSMNNLALVLDNQGKYEEAEQMHRKTLALSEKVLGPENPSTLTSMNNLALVLDRQGKYEEAEQMHRKTLALYEKVLGPENPSTLTSMNNLASVLDNQGKYEEAEQMHRKTLALYEKVLGPENPSTLTSMNNLALVLDSQGKYEEAEQMHRETLALREKVLGPENPSTLTSMNNLASVLDNQGKYEEAEQMHRKTLAFREKVLGPENPSTLGSMDNLAWVLNRQGKYEEAEQMHRETLALREKVLGPENPSTLDSMNNLAWVLDRQGKYEEAEQMHRKTLALREKVLGPENPSTLDSMNNLAWVLNNQGKYEEAEQMHRKTLALSEKVLGPENPSTLTSMNNLALVLDNQGKYEEAEQMHRKTLALYEKVLGPENPSTLTSMNNLASVLNRQGKYEEAEQMHRKKLELSEKVLGPENPSTLTSMNNLASVLDNQGKYEEAEQMHRKTLALREKVLGLENYPHSPP